MRKSNTVRTLTPVMTVPAAIVAAVHGHLLRKPINRPVEYAKLGLLVVARRTFFLGG